MLKKDYIWKWLAAARTILLVNSLFPEFPNFPLGNSPLGPKNLRTGYHPKERGLSGSKYFPLAFRVMLTLW